MDALHMLTPFKPKVTDLHGGLRAVNKNKDAEEKNV